MKKRVLALLLAGAAVASLAPAAPAILVRPEAVPLPEETARSWSWSWAT